MRSRIMRLTTLLFVIVMLVACSNSAPEAAPTTRATAESAENTPTPEPTMMPIPTPEAMEETADDGAGDAETEEGLVSAETTAEDTPSPIVIASKDFTEQLILGALMIELLRANDIEVIDQTGYGGTILVRDALETGEIDLYAEYNGTSLAVHNGIPSTALPADSQSTYELAKTLDAAKGLTWLEMAEFNNTYTMMVRDVLVNQGVNSLDDLKTFIDDTGADIRLCVEAEFFAQPEDGLQAMLELYGLELPEENILITSTAGAYSDLRSGACDVAEGFATDARIEAWGFTSLDDSRNYFPFYNPAPVMRSEIAEQYPEVVELLNQLFGTLNADVISSLNAQVDLGRDGEFDTGDERSPNEVALDYLARSGLLGELPAFNVGVLPSQELTLVTQITNRLLVDLGFDINTIEFESIEAARDALLEGDIDLVWNNTAQALSTFHNLPLDTLPPDSFATYGMIRSLDERYADLTWLQPIGWDNKLVALVKPDGPFATVPQLDDLLGAIASGDASDAVICASTSVASIMRSNAMSVFGIDLQEEQLLVSAESEVYDNLRDDLCAIGLGRSTDPRVPAYGFLRIADPNNRFPATTNAPVVRTLIADQFPEIEPLLADTFAQLDTTSVTNLLARVEYGGDGVFDSGDEENIELVVDQFLAEIDDIIEVPSIVVGSQTFTEQTMLAALTSGVLRDLGFNVIERSELANTEAAYTELTQEQIDIYWTYTGSTLDEIHVLESLPADPAEAYAIAQELDTVVGLSWFDSAEFNDTFALLIGPDSEASTFGTISDLAVFMNENGSPFSLCLDEDFLVRENGLPGLQTQYGFAFVEQNLNVLSGDALYAGLINGTCDVAAGFRTDGRVAALGLSALDDDLAFFPAYNAAPIVRSEFSAENPTLASALSTLAATLTDDTMATLNASVAVGADGVSASGDEQSASDVAQTYLCDGGLITTGCDSETTVAIEASDEPDANCEMVDLNGGFEDDRVWRTPITRSSGEYTTLQSHSGDWAMQLGARGRGGLGSYSIAQTLTTLPLEASSAEISFWYLSSSLDVLGGDVASLHIFDETLSFAREIFTYPTTGEEVWTQATFDLTGFRGEPILLHFLVINDGDGIPTTVFIDDVELQICYE